MEQLKDQWLATEEQDGVRLRLIFVNCSNGCDALLTMRVQLERVPQ